MGFDPADPAAWRNVTQAQLAEKKVRARDTESNLTSNLAILGSRCVSAIQQLAAEDSRAHIPRDQLRLRQCRETLAVA